MEVEIFHVLEFGADGGEQFFCDPDMFVHGAAHIEEHQQLDMIAPFGPRLDIEIAVFGG